MMACCVSRLKADEAKVIPVETNTPMLYAEVVGKNVVLRWPIMKTATELQHLEMGALNTWTRVPATIYETNGGFIVAKLELPSTKTFDRVRRWNLLQLPNIPKRAPMLMPPTPPPATNRTAVKHTSAAAPPVPN